VSASDEEAVLDSADDEHAAVSAKSKEANAVVTVRMLGVEQRACRASHTCTRRMSRREQRGSRAIRGVREIGLTGALVPPTLAAAWRQRGSAR
jgi:hypothetical protein